MLALGGTSAYGIVLFYYFVDRSALHVLVYVCLPCCSLARSGSGSSCATATPCRGHCSRAPSRSRSRCRRCSWRSPGLRSDPVRALCAGARASRRPRAAGRARPALGLPARQPQSPAGERMLARHLPGEQRSVVLIQPNMITEVLMRSGRSNRLPLADPIEDGFAPRRRCPACAQPAANSSRRATGCCSTTPRSAVRPGGPGQRAARGVALGARHDAAPALRAARDRPPLPAAARARRDGFVVVELEARLPGQPGLRANAQTWSGRSGSLRSECQRR